jgi:hypothetical protein
MSHWAEYVRRVATRYRGLIKAYEIWNEPYFSDLEQDRIQTSFFYSGSVANMVEMARIARTVLDEVDPKAILLTPGFVNGTHRLELFLRSGGKQYIQAVAYHFYSASAGQFIKQILEVRQVMERNGLGNLPLWNTETGVEVWPEGKQTPARISDYPQAENAGALIAQELILGAAAGLDRFFYYAWDNDFYGMVIRTGDRLPGYAAMANVQHWLIDARLNGCAERQGGVSVCAGEQGGERFWLVWADRDGTRKLALPAGTTASLVEPLYSTAPVPTFEQQRDTISIALGRAPVRIALASVGAP